MTTAWQKHNERTGEFMGVKNDGDAMLAAFMQGDREFARGRRATGSR